MESAGFSDHYPEVIKSLKQIYGQRIVEAEKRYLFDQFHGQLLRGSDFDAKPMVLLLGQYSVGKTSFIEFLLKRKFPGQRVGPEPTTDRYVAVMYGDEDQTIPGAALSVDPEQPFSGTNQFGSSFLSKFEAAKCNGAILKNLVLVDTPGVLSGEKQRLGRAYDFVQVSSWFAAKADLIILLFDAYKLDISDEFKDVILALKGNDDKIRCVLNKCDAINTQQLMRIYGALMWSLGKVIKTPEALRVYLGSFWDKPYQNTENSKLFRAESADLLDDLLSLPRNSAVRKVNELVKRTRLVIAHSHLICHLGNKMPMLFGKDSTKAELIQDLAKQYQEIEHLHKIAPGDFPEIKKMQEILKLVDFGTFPSFSKSYFDNLNLALCSEIPKLMRRLAPPKEKPDTNPFREDAWVVSDSMKQGFDDLFFSLKPNNLGRLPGAAARKPLVESVGEGNIDKLKKIWELVDFEKTGALDSDEFAIAMYLCQLSKNGEQIPTSLPLNFYPINKRKFFKEGKTTNPF